MLTHAVLFRLTDPADAAEAVARLRALAGRIPTLVSVSAGTNVNTSPAKADVLLVTTHADQAGLDAYQVHPVHKELLGWIGPRIADRVVVDSLDFQA